MRVKGLILAPSPYIHNNIFKLYFSIKNTRDTYQVTKKAQQVNTQVVHDTARGLIEM